MSKRTIKRALISVYDKTGIVDFARVLVDEFAIEIISTGGTATRLRENGIPVTLVEKVTGFPEMMNGRVKTLHPRIHAALLADGDNEAHARQLSEQGIEPIDMVVVNLYPFEKTVADPACTFAQAIEMIDIGGPCMLRAAAKNHRHVVVVAHDPPYDNVLRLLRDERGTINDESRKKLALEAFRKTAQYDSHVSRYLSRGTAEESSEAGFRLGDATLRMPEHRLHAALRYGENPHQQGAAYETITTTPRSGPSLIGAVCVGDKEMSFNNFVDANAAMELCREVSSTKGSVSDNGKVCVFIKHTNACGVGVSPDPTTAYERAYLGDPNAAMGGILACDFSIDPDFAATVMATFDRWGRSAGVGGFFAEVWLAPRFDEQAVATIRGAKPWGRRVRLVETGPMEASENFDELNIKNMAGGVLVQEGDCVGLDEDTWRVVTKRSPMDGELADLRLAWLIGKHTKSNAISLCKENMLIGNGAGQMSRVMSCRIATWLANENGHNQKLSGSAAGSDAFFPFSDGPMILADAGVTAIIQPGGSKRDAEVIASCNEREVAMIFTGTRHFKH